MYVQKVQRNFDHGKKTTTPIMKRREKKKKKTKDIGK